MRPARIPGIVIAEIAGLVGLLALVAIHEYFAQPPWLPGVLPAPQRHEEFAIEALAVVMTGAVAVTVSWLTCRRQAQFDRLLRMCAWCHKVDASGGWLTPEDYLARKDDVTTEHGLCPACYEAQR